MVPYMIISKLIILIGRHYNAKQQKLLKILLIIYKIFMMYVYGQRIYWIVNQTLAN